MHTQSIIYKHTYITVTVISRTCQRVSGALITRPYHSVTVYGHTEAYSEYERQASMHTYCYVVLDVWVRVAMHNEDVLDTHKQERAVATPHEPTIQKPKSSNQPCISA